MPDQDEYQAVFKRLNNVTDTIGNHGMKGLHDARVGYVHFLYSERQRLDHLDLIKGDIKGHASQMDGAGAITALDVTTGAVVRYTDIEVIEGNGGSINYQMRPFEMHKFFRPELNNRIYTDTKKVSEGDPRNFLAIRTAWGQTGCIAFEDPNPRNGSLVVIYGREKALEIVEMLKNLPEGVRPGGVYNGVNGYDSFETVLDLGRTPGALGSRFPAHNDRGNGCRPSPPGLPP